MPSTMTKMDDECSISTPPQMFSPKRQNVDREMGGKHDSGMQAGSPNHIMNVLLLRC